MKLEQIHITQEGDLSYSVQYKHSGKEIFTNALTEEKALILFVQALAELLEEEDET